MSQPKEINDDVVAAMKKYRIKFGLDYPLVFTEWITAKETLADIRRRIARNDPYPDEEDPDLV